MAVMFIVCAGFFAVGTGSVLAARVLSCMGRLDACAGFFAGGVSSFALALMCAAAGICMAFVP